VLNARTCIRIAVNGVLFDFSVHSERDRSLQA
jgi:hypothetical protein